MKKQIFAGLISLSFLLASCGQVTQNFSNLPYLNNIYTQSSLISKSNVQSDWFTQLRPDLQNYYAPAKGKTGAELFDALHKIIEANNKIISYSDSKSFMYAVADNITVNSKPGVIDAYSQIFVSGSGGNGNSYKESGDANKDGIANDFINCEHTWPQSFFNKKLPMVADLHHLQSTLSVPNGKRGSFPFGMAQGSIVYSNIGGAKLSVVGNTAGIKTMLELPYDEDSQIMDKTFDAVFEPPDAQKGNTARAMLYFYLRYYDQNIGQGGFNKNKFWVSKLPNFINWAEQVDPVDDLEIKRNDIILKKQNNRNPFIDIPKLGTLIGENVLESR